jgi:DNA-binding transcriptional MocR family regulator
VVDFLDLISTPQLPPLGVGLPDPSLLPVKDLARYLARVVRTQPESATDMDFGRGDGELRRQLVRRLRHHCGPITPDELVITAGACEAMSLALGVVCSPGDAVAVESPTYFDVLDILEELGLRAVEIPMADKDGMDLEALKRVLGPKPKVAAVVTIPTGHNPTGSVMPEYRRNELMDLVHEADIPLIEDDTYGDLAYHHPPPPAVKAFDRDGLVIHCSSFSKTLAPGWRIGWVAGGRWDDAIRRRKMISSLATNTPCQRAMAAYLSSGRYEGHLRRLRATYQSNSTMLANSVLRHFPAGTRLTPPSSGQFLWVELPGPYQTQDLLATAVTHSTGYAPGPLFSARRNFGHCLRLNAAFQWSDAIDEAVERLGHFLKNTIC